MRSNLEKFKHLEATTISSISYEKNSYNLTKIIEDSKESLVTQEDDITNRTENKKTSLNPNKLGDRANYILESTGYVKSNPDLSKARKRGIDNFNKKESDFELVKSDRKENQDHGAGKENQSQENSIVDLIGKYQEFSFGKISEKKNLFGKSSESRLKMIVEKYKNGKYLLNSNSNSTVNLFGKEEKVKEKNNESMENLILEEELNKENMETRDGILQEVGFSKYFQNKKKENIMSFSLLEPKNSIDNCEIRGEKVNFRKKNK